MDEQTAQSIAIILGVLVQWAAVVAFVWWVVRRIRRKRQEKRR